MSAYQKYTVFKKNKPVLTLADYVECYKNDLLLMTDDDVKNQNYDICEANKLKPINTEPQNTDDNDEYDDDNYDNEWGYDNEGSDDGETW
jgi:hypothetical protein